MTRAVLAAIAVMLLAAAAATAQSTPALDCEIRSAYSDYQDATEVWLTLQPRTPEGKPGPPGTFLTLIARLPGKHPTRPAKEIEVRATVGLLWAPRPEVLFELDGDKIDLDAKVPLTATDGKGGFVYVVSTISIGTLDRIAIAKRVTGSVLGLPVEFTGAQRGALRTFVERITFTSQ